jgi:hypothetical protein
MELPGNDIELARMKPRNEVGLLLVLHDSLELEGESDDETISG